MSATQRGLVPAHQTAKHLAKKRGKYPPPMHTDKTRQDYMPVGSRPRVADALIRKQDRTERAYWDFLLELEQAA